MPPSLVCQPLRCPAAAPVCRPSTAGITRESWQLHGGGRPTGKILNKEITLDEVTLVLDDVQTGFTVPVDPAGWTAASFHGQTQQSLCHLLRAVVKRRLAVIPLDI